MWRFPLLLAVLASVAATANAFHVDYYDESRRLMRVHYDPSAKSPKVLPHFSSSRRLFEGNDTHRPSNWTPATDRPDVLLLVANPDELYIYQNDTAVVIFGTVVELQQFLWNPERDLVVQAARVNLPTQPLKFQPEPNWTGRVRSVYIHAAEVFVPPQGATIDVEGKEGWSPAFGLPAADGDAPGKDGQDGEDAGPGGQGGTVIIKAGCINGGLLTIKADGGGGGKGQDGGNGRMGNVGARRSDISDCCRWTPRGSKGRTGGSGGSGGRGATGGRGGKAGYVQVHYLNKSFFPAAIPNPFNLTAPDASAYPNLAFSAEPGQGGAAGKPGAAGQGGHGGPGVMTQCKRVDMFGLQRLCTFPMGPDGDAGADGNNSYIARPGKLGPPTDKGQTFAGMSLEELRTDAIGQHLRYELFLADKYYRAGDFVLAQWLYVWVASVLRGNHTREEALSPWREIALQASVRLAQLKNGLDFWGHQLDHAPLLSFKALHGTAESLISIAKDAEAAFDSFYADATGTKERVSLIRKAIKNIEYEIGYCDQVLVDLDKDVLQIRDDIIELDIEQKRWEQIVLANAEECDGGISKKVASEIYAFMPNVNRLVTLAISAATIAGELVPLVIGVGGVFSVTAQAVSGFAKIMQSESNSNSDAAMMDILSSSLDQSMPSINTIVDRTIPLATQGGSAWGRVSPHIAIVEKTLYEGEKSFVDKYGKIQKKIQIAIQPAEFRKVRGKYINTVDECKGIMQQFDQLVNISEVLTKKVNEHDMYVVKYGLTEVIRAKLRKELRELLDTSTMTFDPTALQFMQTIGESYRTQKDRIIELLKLLHEAVDYEFCDRTGFTYEDVRVVQLEAYLADITTQRLRRHSEDVSARAIMADFGSAGSVEAAHSQRATSAVTIIKLSADQSPDMLQTFQNYWQNGTLLWNLEADNPVLPLGVANLRIVSAQVFVPALLWSEGGRGNLAEVWMRRLGISRCRDVKGTRRMFSHAPRTYYSIYPAAEDHRPHGLSPKWLTSTIHTDDEVAPSPLGPWEISIPSLRSKASRERVREIEIHIVLSYVPCAMPTCEDLLSASGFSGGDEDDGEPGNEPVEPRLPPLVLDNFNIIMLLGIAACCGFITSSCFARISQNHRQNMNSSMIGAPSDESALTQTGASHGVSRRASAGGGTTEHSNSRRGSLPPPKTRRDVDRLESADGDDFAAPSQEGVELPTVPAGLQRRAAFHTADSSEAP